MRSPNLKVWKAMAPEVLEHLKAELHFFSELTDVSGKLYPVPKDERKAGAVQLVQKVSVVYRILNIYFNK